MIVTPTFGRRVQQTPANNDLAPEPAHIGSSLGGDTTMSAQRSVLPDTSLSELRSACMGRLDPNAVAFMTPERLTPDVERLISELATERRIQINAREQRSLATELVHDILGLGPLEPLLADDGINDIMVNECYLTNSGRSKIGGASRAKTARPNYQSMRIK